MSILRIALLATLVTACTACTEDEATAASSTKFFLPTGSVGTNTSPPTIAVDAKGTIHAVYPAYAGGGAFYAECPANCANEKAMKTVSFATGKATVTNAMMALDRTGHPSVLMVTGAQVLFASCAGDCSQQGAWTTTELFKNNLDLDITGEAFALDPQGRPRFLMHTAIAYLGIGQKPPKTEWVACDANCGSASSWTRSTLSDTQIWGHSTLRFDPTGRAHVATVALVADPNGTIHMGAYGVCDANCGNGDAWKTTGLGTVFTSEIEAVTIHDQIKLAVTSTGQPRIAFLQNVNGQKKLTYYQCTAADCTANGTWSGTILSDSKNLDSGIDLELDAKDHPRIAATLGYNIGVAACDAADCTLASTKWDQKVIENGGDLPPDQIFLYPNCSVGAWFLHDPSLALTADGKVRVAYTARDVSGAGIHTTDPTKPGCVAGTDMLLGRIAIL
ncbi:MAG TPA: hypothetical protein VGC41_20280 [Kofleriaceae bacterium]